MMTAGVMTTRIHGPFISDKEIENIVRSLQKQGNPEYDDDILKEENLENNNDLLETEKDIISKYIEIIKREGKVPTSLLQRKLQIGYNRAARIMDQLEEQDYISQANHVGKREINFRRLINNEKIFISVFLLFIFVSHMASNEIMTKISNNWNQIKSMSGDFQQTDTDGNISWKILFLKPHHSKFEYIKN